MPSSSGIIGSCRREATCVSFLAPQSRPCTKLSTLVSGGSALFEVGLGGGRHCATSSRQPLWCRNDQNVAVPACGLSCWSVNSIWMDWPALWNLIFSATVWCSGQVPDVWIVFIHHHSLPKRRLHCHCIVTAKTSVSEIFRPAMSLIFKVSR